MKNYNFNRKAQGFSLIELLLVLAIVAALAVAAFIIYPRVQAGTSANSASQTLSSASASVRSVFTSGNYANLDTAAAIAGKFFPEGYLDDPANPTALVNEWGGNVTIVPTDNAGGATNSRFFTITYTAVPSEVCKRLAPAAAANFGRVTVEGTEIYNAFTNVPVNETTVLDECGNGIEVDMTFTTQ